MVGAHGHLVVVDRSDESDNFWLLLHRVTQSDDGLAIDVVSHSTSRCQMHYVRLVLLVAVNSQVPSLFEIRVWIKSVRWID